MICRRRTDAGLDGRALGAARQGVAGLRNIIYIYIYIMYIYIYIYLFIYMHYIHIERDIYMFSNTS